MQQNIWEKHNIRTFRSGCEFQTEFKINTTKGPTGTDSPTRVGIRRKKNKKCNPIFSVEKDDEIKVNRQQSIFTTEPNFDKNLSTEILTEDFKSVTLMNLV